MEIGLLQNTEIVEEIIILLDIEYNKIYIHDKLFLESF